MMLIAGHEMSKSRVHPWRMDRASSFTRAAFASMRRTYGWRGHGSKSAEKEKLAVRRKAKRGYSVRDDWAREEFDLRPHAYQSAKSESGNREDVVSFWQLTHCRVFLFRRGADVRRESTRHQGKRNTSSTSAVRCEFALPSGSTTMPSTTIGLFQCPEPQSNVASTLPVGGS